MTDDGTDHRSTKTNISVCERAHEVTAHLTSLDDALVLGGLSLHPSAVLRRELRKGLGVVASILVIGFPENESTTRKEHVVIGSDTVFAVSRLFVSNAVMGDYPQRPKHIQAKHRPATRRARGICTATTDASSRFLLLLPRSLSCWFQHGCQSM